MPRISKAISEEIQRAERKLLGLIGNEIDTITIQSLDIADAAFLGQIVSKLSPMIGNLLERKIVQLLASEDAGHGMDWVRQDPGFPDALLIEKGSGAPLGAGFEIKAWYALSTELTGRFRESQRLLQTKDVRLVVVAWTMSHVVYGKPLIVDVLSVDALSVAKARDDHYHQPPRYLTLEPGDTTGRTSNLQQTNVLGYRLQTDDATKIRKANRLIREHKGAGMDPSSAEAQELATTLANSFPYRLDTNFAKIDRIDHDGIEQFKTRVLNSDFKGRELKAWGRLLKAVAGEDEEAKDKAAEIIASVYPKL